MLLRTGSGLPPLATVLSRAARGMLETAASFIASQPTLDPAAVRAEQARFFGNT